VAETGLLCTVANMFAVPGWNISADKLKTETVKAATSSRDSKKRKRASTTQEVTTANVAELWDQIIEQKAKPQNDQGSRKKDKKRRKREQVDDPERNSVTTKSSHVGDKLEGRSKTAPSEAGLEAEGTAKKKTKKDKKDKTKGSGAQGQVEIEDGVSNGTKKLPIQSSASDLKPTKATLPTPPQPKLTPLQASMREKLVSARFRHLNETLYTKPSAELLALFTDAPDMFAEYHEGFRRQVSVWPENPVGGYIRELKSRARIRPLKKGQPAPADPREQPLPRTGGVCVVADLGCGDAALAAAVAPARKRLRLDVRSFDLHGDGERVTRADIAALPLADGTVDVALFCLALMGTNWLDFVEEAWRVLRWKGELWVAEIKSRFAPAGRKGVVEHSVGNRRKSGAAEKRKAKLGEEQAELHDAAELAVEVDGVEDRRGGTDVSAFVEALRRRGFLLHGEAVGAAVDLSNKMFVKMRFVKATAPVRGKMVVKAREGGHLSGKRKYLDEDTEQEAVNEAVILKPCVYKLR
jgi:ribosomal RNA-processing protein 8